jgi:hypothetical protein
MVRQFAYIIQSEADTDVDGREERRRGSKMAAADVERARVSLKYLNK